MRLWSIHPRYLDSTGLVALWREALLARKVLEGKTRGYRYHPQLLRFRQHPDSISTINAYLWYIFQEARERGYRFNIEKLYHFQKVEPICVTEGQVLYEWNHLLNKLRDRALNIFLRWEGVKMPEVFPIMKVVPGEVEPWEVNYRRDRGGGKR
ncbi:MAG: pyrimidine dimer DNA glycosylase/endonuclease V [Syntrophobacterales bacterium]|nr:pyrimidine dimer DNA glycosylase/endonuclease V [Syntrophobacterales bacterium]